MAIIGGAKVSDKIGVLEKLVEKVDKLLIGGGMAFTFLKALGYEVGKSLCEVDMLDTAREIMEKAKQKGVKLLLPVDCVIAERAEIDSPAKETSVQENTDGLDGPRHRTGHDNPFRRGTGRCEDDRVERPDGYVRIGALQQGDHRPWLGCGRFRCHEHRRGRRYGYGCSPGRRLGPHLLHIDRRRSIPGASGRQDHARGRGP